MAASLVDAFLTSCRTEYGLSYGQAVALVLVWTTLSALYILLLNPLTVPGKGRCGRHAEVSLSPQSASLQQPNLVPSSASLPAADVGICACEGDWKGLER